MKQPKPKTKAEQEIAYQSMTFKEALEAMEKGIVVETYNNDCCDIYRITNHKELQIITMADIEKDFASEDANDWEWSDCEQPYNELNQLEYKPYVKKEIFVLNIREFERYLDIIIGGDYPNKKTLRNRMKRIGEALQNYKK